MNPVEAEDKIRELELMLYGGSPLRPDADYGRQQVGHLDGVKSRSPRVRTTDHTDEGQPQFVVERYIIAQDGQMRIERPSSAEKLP